MALDSFSALKTAIQTWLDNESLADNIPDFIQLAEARHRREIRIREMLERQTLPVTTRFLTIPAGWLEASMIRLLTNPVTVLKQVSFDQMNRIREEGTGKLRYFTVHESIEFDVVPDASVNAEVVFYKALTPLSDGDPSNALLVRAPDAYLYGSLLATAPFLVDDPRVGLWNGLYESARNALIAEERRARNIGPQIARVAGATP